MHPKSSGLEDRAQVGDCRAFAVGAGDMNDRRQPAFGMIEPFQDAPHPVEREIDLFRMKLRQPRDVVVKRRPLGQSSDHAGGADDDAASTTGIGSAGASKSDDGFGAASIAGVLVSSRHSRASIGRNS